MKTTNTLEPDSLPLGGSLQPLGDPPLSAGVFRRAAGDEHRSFYPGIRCHEEGCVVATSEFELFGQEALAGPGESGVGLPGLEETGLDRD